MNPLVIAMKLEQEGEVFYRELARTATDRGFREIFNQLANDESKHYQLFKDMQTGTGIFPETVILKHASQIFKQMVAEDRVNNLDGSQLELYQNAMEMEKKSQELYLEKASETEDPYQQELLRQIAAEEEKHYFLLHNIYELVLRPGIWVENGEFVHLEDY